MNPVTFKDEIPLYFYRVKKEFVLDSILYAVGVVRYWTAAERVDFVQKLRTFVLCKTVQPSESELHEEFERANKFFYEHFEGVIYK